MARMAPSQKAALAALPTAALAAGALLLFLLLASAFLLYGNFQLSGQLSELTKKQAQTSASLDLLRADHSSLNQSYVATKAELEDKNSQLGSANARLAMLTYQLNETGAQLSQTEQQLEASRANLAAQKQQAQQIASDLSGLETNINASMAWFRDNAEFPSNYSWKADIYIKRVLGDCVDGNELNVGCMSYLMENTAFAIHYRTDFASTGKADFLQSVKQTIDSGWGDCEDYSLIFKAALNSARAMQPGLQVVAWAPGGTGNFYIYPKESQVSPDKSYWYVPNAHKVQLGSLDSLHPYVVCYRLNSASGHCTVALSDTPVSSSQGIWDLSGARVFEPQIGEYLGAVGSEFGICNPSYCFERVGVIQIAISDSDLYKFENGAWTSYSDYLSRVKEAKAMLPPVS